MAFVASFTQSTAGAGNISIPWMNDLSGNQPALGGGHGYFSHGQLQSSGAVNIGFDGNPTRYSLSIGNTNFVFAIPTGAQTINVSAACTISFGQDDG